MLKHLTVAGSVLLCFSAASHAQSAYAGQYSGVVHISLSGVVNQPPTPAGGVIFSVLPDGTISSLGGNPTGTVDASGNITWQQPNAFNLTTGTIAAGVIQSTSSVTANGLTTTVSVQAAFGGVGLPTGISLARQLTQISPENAVGAMNAIRYHGADGFIAVGNRGAAALSSDGITWRRSAVPTYRNLNAVARGGGVYVAGGDSGALFTSPDGIDWTPRATPFPIAATSITGAAWGGGKFVITSQFGDHATSSDGGATWTLGTSPAGAASNVRFLDSKFVQTYSGQVRFSADGVSWTAAVSAGVGGEIASVAWENGFWYAAGSTGLARSADGVSWTVVLTGNVGVVSVGGGRVIARMRGSTGVLQHSSDGITWRQGNAVTSVGTADAAYGNGRFVLAGAAMVTSGDGVSWKLAATNPLAPHLVDFIPATGSTINAGLIEKWRAFTTTSGGNPVLPVNAWMTAPSGTYWAGDGGVFFVDNFYFKGLVDLGTQQDLHAMSHASGTQEAIVAGTGGTIYKVRVVGGGATQSYEPIAVSSPTTNTLRSGTHYSLPIFVGDGGTIVRIDASGGLSPAAVIEGSGTTQNLRYVTWISPPNPLQMAARHVAVGDAGTLLVRDGTTGQWTPRNTGTTDNLIGVAYVSFNASANNGYYVAVGENGTVVSSPDLLTWTLEQPIAAPGKLTKFKAHGNIRGLVIGERGFYADAYVLAGDLYFNSGLNSLTQTFNSDGLSGIAHGAGRFVGVGGARAAVSANGLTWQTSLIPLSMNAVAYGAGRFVAVGGGQTGLPDDKRIVHSSDGLSWQVATQPSTPNELNAIAWGSGRFAASGNRGNVYISPDGKDWTVAASDLVANGNSIRSMVHANGIFVGVGDSAVISSTDGGATWVSRGSAGAGNLRSVAYGNGLFVAVGGDGNTIRSSDGVSFSRTQLAISPAGTGARPNFYSVIFADGVFLGMSSDGRGYTSADAVSWQEKFTGLTIAFTGNVVANGQAVFVGGGQIIAMGVTDTSPHITAHPQHVTVAQGATLNLSATVSGTGPFTYQWLKNGVPLANGGNVSGATTPHLAVSGAGAGTAGSYQFIVTSAGGSRASQNAVVTVTQGAGLTFDDWAADFDLPIGKDGPLDDPDHDGTSNLVEYLAGSHPLQPGANAGFQLGGIVPASQLGPNAEAGKSYFSFTVRVRKDRPGITLIPQAASTIQGLSLPGASAAVKQAGPPVADPLDQEFEHITWFYEVAVEDSVGGRAFMRLSAELQ